MGAHQLQHYRSFYNNTSRGRKKLPDPNAWRSKNKRRELDDVATAARMLELAYMYTRCNGFVAMVPPVVCPFCDVVLTNQQLKNHLHNCKEVRPSNQSLSRDLSKCSYRNALTLIDIFGVKTINPLYRNVQSYLPQFSPNPVEELLRYTGIQVTHQERFSVPQEEVGDRLDRGRNELALLSGGRNIALNDREGEVDRYFMRPVSETRGGEGRREFVAGFGMKLEERRRLRKEMMENEKADMVLGT